LRDLDQPAHLGLEPANDHRALAVKSRLDRADGRGTCHIGSGNMMQVQDQAFGARCGDNLKGMNYQADCRPAVNHTVHGYGRCRILPGEFDQKRRN